MEVVRTIGSAIGTIKMLATHIQINKELALEVDIGLKSMKMDFEFISDFRLKSKKQQRQLTPGMELQLQELVYDIDDFIQGLWVPGEHGSLFLAAVGADPRPLIIQRIGDLKDRISKFKKELPKSFEVIPAWVAPDVPEVTTSKKNVPEVKLEGIEGPKEEIWELLSRRAFPHGGGTVVISIVGRSGSGKTALARALYEDEDVLKQFDFKSWVVASKLSSVGIIKEICQEAVPKPELPSTSEHISKDKRYLVFVDDVLRETPLKDIKDAFSENLMDSRIIVTTRVPSVTRDYSSGSYEYTMQPLDQEISRKLFRVKFRGMAGYTEEDKHRLGNKDVDIIIDKCGGLPIALIRTAECLSRKGYYPETLDFEQVSKELCDRLACSDSDFDELQRRNGIEEPFAEMRRACVEPYENLLDHGEKKCLLYVSVFPCGHQISSKSLARRLIAEGLVPGDPDIRKDPEFVFRDVRECVRKLMDQRMIEPVPIRSYSNVAKRCRVHSIMLQFAITKAVHRNFVSLIHEDHALLSETGLVRRLTVQSSKLERGNKRPEGMDLSVLRSLTIFKSRNPDFEECKLVRVLDLEGCCGLTPKDLDKICELLFLKYLSLRNTDIRELPEKVKELEYLEMLDTRGTLVETLPVEVIMLPRFAYLFGKYRLTNVDTKRFEKVIKVFQEKKSVLHTLGGISVDDRQGLETLELVMQNATKLKKVKVWYRDTASSTGPATASTPATGATPEPVPCASKRGQNKWSPIGLFSKGKPSKPRIGTQYRDPATSTRVTNGTQDTIPSASRRGLPKHKLNPVSLFSKRKPSADPSTSPSTNTRDPAPSTTTPIVDGTPGQLSAGLSTDSSSNTQDRAPATSTPVASDAQELIHCVSRMTKTLKKHPITLDSLSIDFNGISNTFLDFLQTNGTISSIKLRKSLGSLPGRDELGKVSNLKKLHLFSTGLKSEQLASLQYLKCLQYLKLAEDGHGLWDSVFHVQVGGFISLIWLCFESSNSLHPPLKIDEGVKTALTSLLLLCEESKGPQTETLDPIIPQMESGDPQTETLTPIIPQGESEDPQKETLLPISPQGGSEDPETETLVLISTQKEIEERIRAEGISHLAKLNEVILHKEVSTKIVDAWKEEAKKHINRPYVEKQQV